MNKTDFVSGAVLLACSTLLLFVVIPWQVAEPKGVLISPRMMPQLCAIAMMILATAQCVMAWRAGSRARGRQPDGPLFQRRELWVLGGVVLLFATALGLYRLAGPLLPALLILGTPMVLMGERRAWVLLLVPAVCITLVYVLLYVVGGSSL